jgi:hypothetical protein
VRVWRRVRARRDQRRGEDNPERQSMCQKCHTL